MTGSRQSTAQECRDRPGHAGGAAGGTAGGGGLAVRAEPTGAVNSTSAAAALVVLSRAMARSVPLTIRLEPFASISSGSPFSTRVALMSGTASEA
mgnify:CR=1 FL=1